MTLNRIFDKFILSKRLNGLSDKTIQDYRDFVGLFVRYIGKESEIEDLIQEDIEEYIEFQLDKHITKTTFATYIRHLKIFIRWVCNNYEVTFTYKSIKVPRTSKKIIHLYSNDEIFKIFDSIEGNEKWIVARNKAIISFMLDSGLRQGEICSLKEENMMCNDNRMTVHGKGDKERIVSLGKQSIALYTEYKNLCPHNSEYVFVAKSGQQMSCNSVKLMVSKLAKKLPFDLSSHKLRHNFATNYCLDMYQKYGQIDIYRLMVLMGHEDIATTRRYLHLANEIIACSESLSHVDKVFKV